MRTLLVYTTFPVDHRGVPNFILQEEDKFLASVYKNKSIAEQNSVDLAWNTLMEPEFEALRFTIFSDLTELKRFRQLLVNCKCLECATHVKSRILMISDSFSSPNPSRNCHGYLRQRIGSTA